MDVEAIYYKYFRSIYHYLLSLSGDPNLSEELAQETFLRALKALDTIDENANVSAWLCKIAKNLYFQHYNKQKRHRDILEKNAREDFAESPEAELIKHVRAVTMHKMVHGLSEPYREVFLLRTHGSLSFKEIGEVFSKSETWARTVYYRARMKLMEEMKNEDNM